MKRKKKIIKISIIFIIFILLVLSYKIYIRNKYVTKDFESLDLSHVDSIMIVAHPDDEILWGGSHLLDGNYLVVCITAGDNATRAKEFLKVMKETNDIGIMLGYPDKTFFRRNSWHSISDNISEAVTKLLALKKWKAIVTHNPEGEYGHIHHVMTSNIVTDIYKDKYIDRDNLYYFGNYYKKSEIGSASNSLTEICNNNYNKKLSIIKNIYTSQDFLWNKFGHMMRYENFYKY